MKHQSKRENIEYLTPMFLVSNLLAISPRYNTEKHTFDNSRGYRLYTMAFIILATVVFLIGLYLKLTHVFVHFKTTLIVVNVLASTTFFLINIVSITSISYVYTADLTAMMQTMLRVDKKLIALQVKPFISPKEYYVNMIVGHIITLSLITYDSFIWGEVSTEACIHSLIEGFMKYHMNGFFYFMSSFIECITIRFSCMNELLVMVPRKQKIALISTKVAPLVMVKNVCVKDVIKIYNLLCDMVDSFNNVFGWILLLMNINIICNFLHGLDFIMEYKSAKFGDYDGGVSFVVLMLMWVFGVLCMGIQLASTCDKAAKEGQKINAITYKMLQDVALNVVTPDQRQLKADLTTLSEHAALRVPQFTAAGFFVVDYTMLFTLLGSITSYLVVLIQFN